MSADEREVTVSFRLTSEQNHFLLNAAAAENLTVSQIIRKALGIYLFRATGPFEMPPEPKPIVIKCNRPHYEKCTRRHKHRRKEEVSAA
jgi:hypothetical protein